MSWDVLVTGGAGFIGRNLASTLRDAGHRVTVLDNLSVEPELAPPADLDRRDVRDLRAEDLERFDAVVHLACLKSVPDSFTSQGSITHNIDVDHHVLRTFGEARRPRRLLLASSCEVYGDQPQASAETRTLEPRSPYAVGKVASEHLASVYSRLHPDREIGVLRFFNVYGPDEGGDAVVPRFIDQISSGQAATLEGDGSQARDFSHVDDICAMVATVLLDDAPPDPVLNLGSGTATTIGDLYRHLARLVDGAESVRTSSRPNEISSFVADMGRYVARYGAAPERRLATALDEVFHERRSLRLEVAGPSPSGRERR